MSNTPTLSKPHLEALFQQLDPSKPRLIFGRRRDRKPTADLGHGREADGGNVPSCSCKRRARAAARPTTAAKGIHRLALDVGCPRAHRCHVQRHVCGRPYPNRPRAGARAYGRSAQQDRRRCPGVGRLRREPNRALRSSAPARSACRFSCSRKAPTSRSPPSTARSRPSQAERAAGLTLELRRGLRICCEPSLPSRPVVARPWPLRTPQRRGCC